MEKPVIIREMQKADIPEVLRLMEAIVVFEGDTDFSLTENDLLKRGFGDRPEFGAIVAQGEKNQLIGIAVHYNIPFMHNHKPSLMLKWLYVDTNHRGKSVGRKLLSGLAQYAMKHGYKKFNWFVLGSNVDAQKFYLSIGANPDNKWIRWTITPDNMVQLFKE
ncbi:ribosomal-protein-alanine N-acetyltransferase [Sphingobacterium sp. JUb20]|nr:ribosomal protein S18 acetylase RimI-like enzyme [Sphingobacterium sp. JUb21]TCR10601.1 ribosomal-protein-alanine N-acetyltransferase [Sphingobacterium sp. JUb20]